MFIPRLTAFRYIAGHYRGDGEEQQESQNGGLHDDFSVERTADGMLWQVTATEVIPRTVRRRWRLKVTVLLCFFRNSLLL
jgi:hypothetical protein